MYSRPASARNGLQNRAFRWLLVRRDAQPTGATSGADELRAAHNVELT